MLSAPLPDNEPTRLAALRATGLVDSDYEPAFDDLARIAASICGTPIALISLIDEHRQWFKAHIGITDRQLPRDSAFCAHAILTPGQTFIVEDTHLDERFADNPLVLARPFLRFYAGTPLVTAEGAALGTLCVIDREPRTLDERQIASLNALGRQVIAQIRLRESEARQRALLEAVPDGLMRIAADGRVLDVRVGRDDVLLGSLGELRGASVGERLPATLAPRLLEMVGKALAGGSVELLEYRLSAQGQSRDIEFHMVRSGSADVVAVVRDVTLRKESERLKSEFIATVSHELRTPLTSIRGALRLLEAGVGGDLPAQATQLIGIACANAERLIRLINDLLDLEKMTAGRLELSLEDLDAARLGTTALAGIRGLADQAGISLRSELGAGPGDRLIVRGDEGRLIQVLNNLLSNAIKFSPPESSVLLVVQRAIGDRVRFSVVDHGPGIPLHQRHRLFGRFEQLDSSDSRQKGGTGLGLAICKSIVEQHGGEIGLQADATASGDATIAGGARVSPGTTFWFELPGAGT